MKKKICFICICLLFLLTTTACTLGNTPTSAVERVLTKYNTNDEEILVELDDYVNESDLTDEQSTKYKNVYLKQFKDMKYEIKEEKIDGDTATVTVEIEVTDLKKSINDLVYDSNIYTKDTYDEEKLNRLEKAKDKVKYTLELTLTKSDRDEEWKLNALTNEDIKKIQGMY